MKESPRPELTRKKRITVDCERTVGFMSEERRDYGTPYLVEDIERTDRELSLEHVDASEDSAGTELSVHHLAPTLLGMEVEITVRVAAVAGPKVTFEVSTKDEVEPIATNSHTRFVVDVAKTHERLKAKAAKRAAASAG
jgi:predicted thioesterase